MKTIQLYLHDLKELLEAREFVMVRTCLRDIPPVDLAEAWDYFTPEERSVVFRLSNRARAVQLFEELDPPAQAELVAGLQKDQAEELLEEIDPSETGRMLRGLPQPMVRHLNGILKKSGQEIVQKYLDFPPQSVGALMRGRYFALDSKWSSKQAIERIQLTTRLRRLEETHLDTLMVVDGESGPLVGAVSLKALVVSPKDMSVRELMDPGPTVLSPEMDQEEAVRLFAKYKLRSAPVVGADGKLMGIVDYRDVYEVASAETEEDFAKMAGMPLSPAEDSVWLQTTRRLPWLVITCIGGLGVSTVVKYYEGTLAQILALASFSPLIAGMGGNVGSQTATLIVRGMATGEIKAGQEAVTIVKEIGVGALLGVIYGCGVAAAAYLFYGSRYGWELSAVVGLSMLFSMTVASTLAAGEPFIFRHFGIDPATATGPLITTTTDLLSNIVYFGLATYLLL